MGTNLGIPLWLFCMTVWVRSCGSNLSSNVCNCWKKGQDPKATKLRIVGGTIMSERDHTSLALVHYRNLFTCGGSVVNHKHVLTAAHCVAKRRTPEDFTILLGVHDRVKEFNSNVKSYSVEKIIVHQNFFKTENKILINDIALFQINEIEFSTFIQPICLPFNFDWSGYKSAVVEGWGLTKEAGYPSRFPRRVTLSVLSNKQCHKSKVYEELKLVKHIDEMVLCAYKALADSCQGDSGGPLLVKTANGTSVQIGIVSFGAGCSNDKGYAGLYTRVSNYVEWLQKHLQINCSA